MKKQQNHYKSFLKNYVYSRWQGRATSLPYTPFGLNDLEPQKTLAIVQRSSSVSRAINLLHTFVLGDGFDSKYGNTYEFEKTMINSNGDTINDVLVKLAMDEILFGGHALNISYTLNPVTKKIEAYEFQHVAFENIRKGLEDAQGKFSDYYIVPFANYSERKSLIQNIHRIDPFTTCQTKLTNYILNAKGIENWGGTLYYSYQESPFGRFYPSPFYASIYEDAVAEAQLKSRKLTDIASGFTAKAVMTKYNPNPTDADRIQDTESLQDFLGEDGSTIMLQYAANRESKPDLDPINVQNVDSVMLNVEKSLKDNIIEQFKIHPSLYGSLTTGKLGSSSEMQEHIDYTQKILVNPIQRRLENTFEKIFSQFSEEKRIEMNVPSRFYIKNISIIKPIENENNTDNSNVPTVAPSESAK